MVYVAGQIPLCPATMVPVQGGILPQARLALRHTHRVLQAVAAPAGGLGQVVLALCYVTDRKSIREAEVEWRRALGTLHGDIVSTTNHHMFCGSVARKSSSVTI